MRKANYEPDTVSFCIRLSDCPGRYSMSEAMCRRVAEAAGALIKVGRSVRVIVSAMDEYLLSMPTAPNTQTKRYERYAEYMKKKHVLNEVKGSHFNLPYVSQYDRYEDVSDLCEKYATDIQREEE